MKYLSMLLATAWLVLLSSCAHTDIAEDEIEATPEPTEEQQEPSKPAPQELPNSDEGTKDTTNKENIVPPPPGLRDPDDLIVPMQ